MNTLWIIGDSTVEDNKPPFRGWGWALRELVRPDVTVRNHALSGRSSRSFWNEGLFVPIEKEISEGDALLIQFGHNDEKDNDGYTDPQSTYPAWLGVYCDLALAHRAQPVLLTPVARRFFLDDGSLLYTHGEYPGAVRQLAAARGIPLCDLNRDSRALYQRLGPEKAAELFVRLAPGEHPDFPDGHDDKTHFNAHGAQVIAGLVAEEMRAIPALAGWLRD